MALHYSLDDINAFYASMGPCFRGHDVSGVYEVLEDFIDRQTTINVICDVYMKEYYKKDRDLTMDFLKKFEAFLEHIDENE
jgi:hypothetical protein